jgi:hypothetical protein
LSNVRDRKFLDKMLGSEKRNMPRPVLKTLDNMRAVLEAAGIGMNEVEFFHPNGNDPEQVVRLGEEETATGHALEGALCRKWTVAPPRKGVEYKCSPLRTTNAQQMYTLVSGSVSLFTIDWDQLDFTELVLRIGDPAFVPEGMSYCMLFTEGSIFLETTFASESEVDWNPEWKELVKNEHLPPQP